MKELVFSQYRYMNVDGEWRFSRMRDVWTKSRDSQANAMLDEIVALRERVEELENDKSDRLQNGL